MAVVQISRIQVRRGQKNQGSGLPQLAGGEFGWAVDTRELYIGNGAVSEGAPAVGNTKVITEHDNLFTLANSYTYLNNTFVQTGANSSSPVLRSLQSRLDDFVSIKSFGADGDDTDVTVNLQRAIDQLFINPANVGIPNSRVVLHFPPGNYRISNTLKLPPFTTILGAGSDKTVIKQSADLPVFQTVNGTSTPGNHSDDSSSTTLNQARLLDIKGITIDTVSTTSPTVKLISCRNSIFEDVEIIGPWSTGDSISMTNAGIELSSLSTLVSSNDNSFKNIRVKGHSVAISSDYDIADNIIENSTIEGCGYGVVFGNGTTLGAQGQATGPIRNKITKSKFRDIDREALWIEKGQYNTSSNNYYEAVGNNGGTESNALYHNIIFTQPTNTSQNDTFDRTPKLSFGQEYSTDSAYKSEIKGYVDTTYGTHYRLPVTTALVAGGNNNNPLYLTLFRLPGDLNRNYTIEYNYRSNAVNAIKKGKLQIVINADANTANVTDDFDYLGDSAWEEAMSFQANFRDANGDTELDTVDIGMLNSTPNDDGEITFTFKIQS